MFDRNIARCVGWLLLLAATGCGTTFMKTGEAGALSSPPAGKALVNFFRPTSYPATTVEYPVLDREKLIGNTKGGQWFQYVCEPGEHVFIAKKERVNVIQANLLAGEVYDVVINIAMGYLQTNITMEPVTPNHPRRDEVEEWESAELLVLDPEADDAELEHIYPGEIQLIMKDFLNGHKKHRVKILAERDHR